MKNNVNYDRLWNAIIHVDDPCGEFAEYGCPCGACAAPELVEFGFDDKPAVIFDDEKKTTMVTFPDGETVTVKCGERDVYSRSAGLAAPAAKYLFGSMSNMHAILKDPGITASGTEQKIKRLIRKAKKGNKNAEEDLRGLFPLMNRMLDDDDAGEHYRKLKEEAEEALGFYKKPEKNDITEMIMSSLDQEPPVTPQEPAVKKRRTRRKKEDAETA